MDSEHRHELKTNELADLLAHFPEFLKRNVNPIIGISLIVIGLITWPMFTKMSRQKTITEESQVSKSIQMLGQDIGQALQSYQSAPEQLNPALSTILVNANALIDLTGETDNPNLAALAYIKAAQAIRTELHLRKEIVSPEILDTQTQKAQEAYEKAAQMAVIPTMKAMAQFGTALCTEERGQTQQAAEIYRAIIDDAGFAATVFPKLAQQRLDSLDDNAESFTFVETAPVESEEAPSTEVMQTPEATTVEAEPAETPPPAAETEIVEPDSEE
ncbi:MAG: hypothetical protein ISS71_00225 [Phycisphaerae bacterium]|nr:hypothetical protein [Phycisphaerae bacterium]